MKRRAAQQRMQQRTQGMYGTRPPPGGRSFAQRKPGYHDDDDSDDDLDDFIVDEEEDDSTMDWRRAMRSITKYNPSKYRDELYDDRKMEAGYDEILAEERRSMRLGRQEDELEEEAEFRRQLEKKKRLRK